MKPAHGLPLTADGYPLTAHGLPLTAHGLPLTKIIIEETSGIDRFSEPVTVGIPFPKGMLKDGFVLSLRDSEAGVIPVQTQTLATWGDGSAKWVLLDFQVSVKRGTTKQLEIADGERGSNTEIPGTIVLEEKDECLCVRTGVSSYFLNKKVFKPFDRLLVNETEVLDGEKSRTVLALEAGTEYEPMIEKLFCETIGPMRTTLKAEGVFKSSDKKIFSRFFSRLHFFANRSMVKVDFTIHNLRAAKHPGGLWDLGDPGSIFFQDLSLHLALKSGETSPTGEIVLYEDEMSEPSVGSRQKLTAYRSPLTAHALPLTAYRSPLTGNLVIYQDSSGGENWRSSNHVNRNGEVKHSFKGYRVYQDRSIIQEGTRANPVVSIKSNGNRVSGAIQYFWQNFPKALEVNDSILTARLFPKHYNDVFELQGGEQKTHTFYLDFHSHEDRISGLEWIQAPLIAHASPEWYRESRAFYYLIPESDDPNRDVVDLINTAICGKNTFFDRREIIDEYGWRNFGDLYADHEAILQRSSGSQLTADGLPLTANGSRLTAHGSRLTADGYPLTAHGSRLTAHELPTSNQPPSQPLVSHYNNQYDCIYGMLIQFVRSSDIRWFRLADQLCDHVKDIDIYHTGNDRPEFNHGLFWHTEHYIDAQTATHRCFSKRHAGHRNLDSYGGGPSLSHNYSTGFLYHYYMTGNPTSKEAVLTLASFVSNNVGMENTFSNQLIKKLRGAHLLLKNTLGKPELVQTNKVYGLDGPGRASGNSLSTLLDAYALTEAPKYLKRADDLILHCVHPAGDIEKRDLLDTENRWMYTVFLQALGKYLDIKTEREQIDYMFQYARTSLIIYAKWMVDNEYPFLSKPEKLEYPNETWAAQDIRKCNTLLYVAKYSSEPLERDTLIKKAEYFYKEGKNYLFTFETKTLTRPIALMMLNGMMYSYFKNHEIDDINIPESSCGFGKLVRIKSLRRWMIAMPGSIARTLMTFSLKREIQFLWWRLIAK